MRRILALLALLALLPASRPAGASDWNGQGSNDKLSERPNWVNGIDPPNNGTALLRFMGSTRPTPFAEVPWSVNQILFEASTDFLLDGQPITVFTSIGTSVNDTAGRPHTIRCDVTAGNNVLLVGSFGEQLRIDGDITIGSFDELSVQGPYLTTLAGDLSGGVLRVDLGNLRILGTNPFTNFDMYGGTVTVGSDQPWRATVPADVYTTTTLVVDDTINNLGRSIQLVSGDLVFDVDGTYFLDGLIASDPARTVTKTGSGSVALGSGTNGQLATIDVQSGQLTLTGKTEGDVVVGDGVGGIDADVVVTPNPAPFVVGNHFGSGAIHISQSGLLDLTDLEDLRDNVVTIEGGRLNSNLGRDYYMDELNTLASSQTARIGGNWRETPGADVVWNVASGSAQPDALVTAYLDWDASSTLVKRGDGDAALSASPTSSFAIEVEEGTLELSTLSGLPAGTATVNGSVFGTALTLGADNQLQGRNLYLLTSFSTFDLGPHSDTVGDIALDSGIVQMIDGAGSLTLQGDIFTNHVSSTPTIYGTLDLDPGTHTVDVAPGSFESSANLSCSVVGTGKLVKEGTGGLAMWKSGSYSGGTDIVEGKIRVRNGGSSVLGSGPVTVFPGAELQMEQGTVSVSQFDGQPGSTLDLQGGILEVVGGTMTFPTDSFHYGSSPQFATLKFSGGCDASVRYSYYIGDAAGTGGVTLVEGMNGTTPSTLRSFGGGAGVDLQVGHEGTGTLSVADGGLVSFADDFRAGHAAGATGSVIIDGVNNGSPSTISILGTSPSTEIGRGGSGTLFVVNGGRLETSLDLNVATLAGSQGSVDILGAQDGQLATIDVGDDLIIGGLVSTAGGTATVTVGTGGLLDVNDLIRVWPGGTLRIEGGELRATTLESDLGTFEFIAGTLAIDNTQGDLTTDGSELSPGDSPGTTNIGGDYTVSTGSLRIELGGFVPGSEHDLVTVTGTATLSGTLNVELLAGHSPVWGQSYTILTAGAVAGTFDTVNLPSSATHVFKVAYESNSVRIDVVTPTGVDDGPSTPRQFALLQNAPNPFNPSTQIAFDLPNDEAVSLEIFNLAGRHVATLVNRRYTAGRHTISWNGTDDAGRPVASGVYAYWLRAGSFDQRRSMVLVR